MSNYGLEGMDQFLEAMRELPTTVKAQVLKSYNRKMGQEFIVKGLRATVPWKSVKKGLGVKSAKNDPTGVNAGFNSDVFWVRFVDGGTKERISKGGKSKGSIKARNIVGPFIDSQIENMVEYTSNELGNEIAQFLEKKIARLNKRLG